MLARFLCKVGFSGPQLGENRPRSECIFCRVCDGLHTDSKTIVHDQGSIVVFPDIAPAGVAHYQVVTREHIPSVNALHPSYHDHELVKRMLEVGQAAVARLHPGAEVKFGFHLPPFFSVPHLHMHAIVLPHKPWWAAYKYVIWTPWWLPAEQLIQQLAPPDAAPH